MEVCQSPHPYILLFIHVLFSPPHPGLRSDFRRSHELRTFSLSIPTSSTSSADGVATCSHGMTTVLATVHGPREAKMRSGTLFDRAVLNVEVGVGAWAGSERRRRGRGDKSVDPVYRFPVESTRFSWGFLSVYQAYTGDCGRAGEHVRAGDPNPVVSSK